MGPEVHKRGTQLLQLAGLRVAVPGSDIRPADLLLNLPEQSAPTAVDVVEPLYPSSRTAEDTAGGFVQLRERFKAQQSSASCAVAGWTSFVPCVAEGLWGMGPLRPVVRSLVYEADQHAHRNPCFGDRSRGVGAFGGCCF